MDDGFGGLWPGAFHVRCLSFYIFNSVYFPVSFAIASPFIYYKFESEWVCDGVGYLGVDNRCSYATWLCAPPPITCHCFAYSKSEATQDGKRRWAFVIASYDNILIRIVIVEKNIHSVPSAVGLLCVQTEQIICTMHQTWTCNIWNMWNCLKTISSKQCTSEMVTIWISELFSASNTIS